MAQVGGFIPWVTSMLDVDVGACCSMRERFNPFAAALPRRQAIARQQAAGGTEDRLYHPSSFQRATPSSDFYLPSNFFENLAHQAVNDAHMAAKISDDSPLIWSDAKSMRLFFLQMCIRDQNHRCRELWWQLQDSDRAAFRAVYLHGPSAPDFFSSIMLHGDLPDYVAGEEGIWREWSDDSDAGSR